MTISNVDATIVGVFLITTLIVGITKGFGVKTVREYAVGNKDFSDFVLISTVFASVVGGNTIFCVSERVFSIGIIYFAAVSGYVIQYIIVGNFLGTKLDNFQNKISSGEIIGEHYGKYGRIISGALGFFYCAGILAMQIIAIGYSFNLFLDIPKEIGAMIGFGIVVIYSAIGGIRSVTFTDIFQFIIIIAIIPLVSVEALRKAGDYNGLFTFLKTNYTTHINPFLDKGLLKEYIPLFFIFCIPTLNPMLTQRILMARTGKQAKSAFMHTALFSLILFIFVALAGLSALKLNSSLNPSLAFPYIIQKIMPVGLMGIAIAGMLAAIMSTADSYLNAGSLSLVHDTIKPLLGNKLLKKHELPLIRITTFIVGIVGFIISTKHENILSITLSTKKFWMPMIVPALIGTILGYKTSKIRFWSSMASGIAFLACWSKFLTPTLGIKPLLPATFCNALIFFGPKLILKVILLGLTFPIRYIFRRLYSIVT